MKVLAITPLWFLIATILAAPYVTPNSTCLHTVSPSSTTILDVPVTNDMKSTSSYTRKTRSAENEGQKVRKRDMGPNSGTIAGAVIGGVFGLLILILIIVACFH